MKSLKCDFCEKTIDGDTDKELEHLMTVHVMCKHNEEFKGFINKEKKGDDNARDKFYQ